MTDYEVVRIRVKSSNFIVGTLDSEMPVSEPSGDVNKQLGAQVWRSEDRADLGLQR